MNKTKIEWCDYSINPVKGLCPVACHYCYARRMYKRFKWNPEIRYDDYAFGQGLPGKIGNKYFIGSTMELFGPWIEEWWMKQIFEWVTSYPQRTFTFLTKQPQNLAKWSPFPKNCYVGVSVTNQSMVEPALCGLSGIQAKIKFLSIEPMLDEIKLTDEDLEVFNWLIIGQQTPPSAKTAPKIEWIKEIVELTDKEKIPVFLKHNLWNLLYEKAWDDDIFWANEKATLRQEFPKI